MQLTASILQDPELSLAAQYVLVANTPYFLVDRLRTLPFTHRLASEHTPAELVAAIVGMKEQAQSDPEVLVALYVMIVALSHVQDKGAIEAIAASFQLHRPKWFDDVLAYVAQLQPSVRHLSFDFHAVLEQNASQVPPNTTSGTSFSTFKLGM